MIRTTLIALVSALTLGTASAALAGQIDGDANPIAGGQAWSVSALERSYAGPQRRAAPAVQDRSYFDRHTQVD